MPMDLSLAAGISSRPSDLQASASVGWGRAAAQLEYIDEGQQPFGILNVNKVVNTDIVYFVRAGGQVKLNFKFGLTMSRYSHNGSGNHYVNDTYFTGWNSGIGLEYQLPRGWFAHAEVMRMRYQQTDKPDFEYFTVGFAGIGYRFSL
jgi:hypothetical protein